MGFRYVFSPEGAQQPLFSLGCVLADGSHCGSGGQRGHSKDGGGGGGGEEPLSAQVQLLGHLVVMSSR